MRRKMTRILALALLSVLWQACLSTGRDFPSRTDWIQKDRTRKDDVKLVLGAPYAVGSSSGTQTWTYAYYKYTLFGRTYYKELRLHWTEGNIVKTFSFDTSLPEDLHEMSQVPKK